MRLTDTDHDSHSNAPGPGTASSAPEAGPSSSSLPPQIDMLTGSTSNGRLTNAVTTATNGHSRGGSGNGAESIPLDNRTLIKGKGVASHPRVELPGTRLFPDSWVDREEFVRLVVQTLRDVGYAESAATLEAESGYVMESREVLDFRQAVLNALWDEVERTLPTLIADRGALRDAQLAVSQQKYLELLESNETTRALDILRTELAPLHEDVDRLHHLSSLMMCSSPEEVRESAGWPGSGETSRIMLLQTLQMFIPPTIMLPPFRLPTLLSQSRALQTSRCLYHNAPTSYPEPSHSHSYSQTPSTSSIGIASTSALIVSHHQPASFSNPYTSAYNARIVTDTLLADHQCERSEFPGLTTHILAAHTDEVWSIEWSHDGQYLASSGQDKTAIIWRIGPALEPAKRECVQLVTLRDHKDEVGAVAWSLDDTVLLTCADSIIKMWHAKSGVCLGDLKKHTDTVTALRWLVDGSGFVSAGMDRQIVFWDTEGRTREPLWDLIPIRVTDLALTPDGKRLLVVGFYSVSSGTTSTPSGDGGNITVAAPQTVVHQIMMYDMNTRQLEASRELDGELTSVKITADSRYALVNQAPDEIYLWDLSTMQMSRKYVGQRQGRHVIRSCFGGAEENFVVSGSEDGKVYVWNRETTALLEVLSGHGVGSVNSVAWNPKDERMFASCSDDHQIRIWEPPPPELFDVPDGGEVNDRQSDGGALPYQNGKGKGKSREPWDSPEEVDDAAIYPSTVHRT